MLIPEKIKWMLIGVFISTVLFTLLKENPTNTEESQKVSSKYPFASGNISVAEDLLKYGNPEKLTRDSLKDIIADRKKSHFKEDANIPQKYRTKHKDYYKSGYDRGHLAPASDFISEQEAMDQSFYFSNIVPQVGVGFNRNYWMFFEKFCRKLVRFYEEVYVITGPLYLPKKQGYRYFLNTEVIGDPPSIIVPTHFFKVILGVTKSRKLYFEGFVLPNKQIPAKTKLAKFITNIDIIERSSGLSFFELVRNKEYSSICSMVICDV